MYVDGSRIADLTQIKKWMNDTSYSLARRKMFRRTYTKIQSQLHDQKLAAMRNRLVKATKAENKVEMWKITNQIKSYSKEELIGQRYE